MGVSTLTLRNYYVIEIGADRAEHSCLKINNTAFLVTGDALATFDPSTGLGCNKAIQSADDFIDFVVGMGNNENLDELLKNYATRSLQEVMWKHAESKNIRSLYRPDAMPDAT